jgi:hypothetical protein
VACCSSSRCWLPSNRRNVTVESAWRLDSSVVSIATNPDKHSNFPGGDAYARDAAARDQTQPPTRRTAVCPWYCGVSAWHGGGSPVPNPTIAGAPAPTSASGSRTAAIKLITPLVPAPFCPSVQRGGMMGSKTWDGMSRSRNTVLRAIALRVARASGSPVFQLTSKRGKLLEDTSRRMR